MKTAREYRSLAWDQLRANFKQSFFVVLVAFLIALVGVGLLCGAIFYLVMSPGFVSASVFSAALIAMLLTTGLLSYYQPVWFMALCRKQPERWYDVRTPYGRALLASLFVLLPTMFSQSVNGASEWLQHADSISPTVKLFLALLILGTSTVMLAFVLWYSYSIAIMLPYKVYDREDRSVFGLVKDTFLMMNGYRWKLFCVDFFILVWPLVVIYFLCLVLGVVLGLNMAGLIDGNAYLGAMVITIVFLTVVGFVYMFMIEPMRMFAHALFYEDMQGEKERIEN